MQLLWRFEAALVVSGHLFGIGLLLAQMLVVSHWLGCIWFILGSHPREAEWSWLLARYVFEDGDALDTSSPPDVTLTARLDSGDLPGGWRTWWLRSMYWTTTTMTTTGYGDITPLSDAEIVFTILVVLFGHVLFAYLCAANSNRPRVEMPGERASRVGCS